MEVNKMFRNAKVGDRVWHIRKGYGKIYAIDNNSKFRIHVQFEDESNIWFLTDGREFEGDINPSLFWDEINFEIPEKSFDLKEAFKILEEIEFKEYTDNYYIYYDMEGEELNYDSTRYRKYLGIKFFTKKSILDFIKNTINKNITEEEFFEAYKNVFGVE